MAHVLQKYNVFELCARWGFLYKERPLEDIVDEALVEVVKVHVLEHLVVESAQLGQIRHHKDDVVKDQFAVVL